MGKRKARGEWRPFPRRCGWPFRAVLPPSILAAIPAASSPFAGPITDFLKESLAASRGQGNMVALPSQHHHGVGGGRSGARGQAAGACVTGGATANWLRRANGDAAAAISVVRGSNSDDGGDRNKGDYDSGNNCAGISTGASASINGSTGSSKNRNGDGKNKHGDGNNDTDGGSDDDGDDEPGHTQDLREIPPPPFFAAGLDFAPHELRRRGGFFSLEGSLECQESSRNEQATSPDGEADPFVVRHVAAAVRVGDGEQLADGGVGELHIALRERGAEVGVEDVALVATLRSFSDSVGATPASVAMRCRRGDPPYASDNYY
eukprot:gene4504-biopygen5766